MTELKKVSDTEREFLAALGETPADHQKQMLNRFWDKTYSKAHQARAKLTPEQEARRFQRDLRRSMNKDVERRLTFTEPVAKVVEKMKAPEIQWVPDAYVIFIRKWICDCGQRGSCLDQTYLFLRHRAKKLVDPEQSRLYVPVRHIELPTLPRLREVRFAHLHVCEHCLETVACQTKPSPSSQAATASCGSSLPSVQVSSEPPSVSIAPPLSESSMPPEVSAGSTSVTGLPEETAALGQDSASEATASPAPAVA